MPPSEAWLSYHYFVGGTERAACFYYPLERRAASRLNGGFQSNSVNNSADVRRLANSWARLVRERLGEAPRLSRGVATEEQFEAR